MKKRDAAKPRVTFKPAKLYVDTHTKLGSLTSSIARHGWAGFGIDRDDVPSIAAVIDAAVNLLIERGQEATKGRRS